MDARPFGQILLVIGGIIAIVGLFFYLNGPRWFPWLGRLPGDIRIETEHTRFYFPIVTCLIISLVLSLILMLISRLR